MASVVPDVCSTVQAMKKLCNSLHKCSVIADTSTKEAIGYYGQLHCTVSLNYCTKLCLEYLLILDPMLLTNSLRGSGEVL